MENIPINLPLGLVQVRNVAIPQIKPSCGPIFFAESLEIAAGNVKDSGSFGLINTGKKKLLVTCHHVVEGFRDLKSKQPKLMLCLALGITPEVLNLDALIDEDKELDLAVFDMAGMMQIPRERVFFPFDCKQKCNVAKENVLLVIGYPGRHRVEFDKAIYWGTTPHLSIASDVTERNIYSSTQRMVNLNRQRLSGIYENPYGGVSGSLCFVLQKDFRPQLVGVVSKHAMETMTITRLQCLRSDGMLKK
jgi:hypothetical protein